MGRTLSDAGQKKQYPLLDGLDEICSRYRDHTDRKGWFQAIFETIHGNWRRFRSPDRWPLPKNWQLRVASECTYQPDSHLEKQLQKRIARCLESRGWGNDVPTCSGLLDSGGRHVNIDLAQQIERGFRFVELKVASNDPFEAACQIARYFAIYLLYRLEPELTRRFATHAMFHARRIDLEVLAPWQYFQRSDIDLVRVQTQLDSQVRALSIHYKEDLAASFSFRAFQPGFQFCPDMPDQEIIQAMDERLSPFVDLTQAGAAPKSESNTFTIWGASGQQIRCFQDWEIHGLPAGRSRQWKEHRSEYELARSWSRVGPIGPPAEMLELLHNCPGTSGTMLETGWTQHETPLPFGDRAPRCHDLALAGRRYGETTTICIEAKADEPFGRTVLEELHVARRRPRTSFPDRLSWLTHILFGMRAFDDPDRQHLSAVIAHLSYQLFTAVAGTLIEAQLRRASCAVFLVHEFRTPATDDLRQSENAEALHRFINALFPLNGASPEPISLQPGKIVGPITMMPRPIGDLPHLVNEIPLFIGKIRTETQARAI